MTLEGTAALVVRCGLVLLFLPFSALDKVLAFDHAVNQAQQIFSARRWLAVGVLLTGLAIEVFGSLAVVTGIADRAAAFVIAGYCAATAVLFKRFWTPGDWSNPDGKARGLFWDFLKNLSLGAGFLLIVVGADGSGLRPFLDHPFASSQPYGSSR